MSAFQKGCFCKKCQTNCWRILQLRFKLANIWVDKQLKEKFAKNECKIVSTLCNIKDLCVKKPYGKLSIVMKCPYKFDESENVHRVKCP